MKLILTEVISVITKSSTGSISPPVSVFSLSFNVSKRMGVFIRSGQLLLVHIICLSFRLKGFVVTLEKLKRLFFCACLVRRYLYLLRGDLNQTFQN